MQRTPQRCPCCSQPLAISWDMWGQYYVCPGCGFTAEDDDELTPRLEVATSRQAPALLTSLAQSYRVWEATQGR